jgi:serine/threonine protein kinase/tetratricopeptide (TPR) repeat protein
MAEGIEARAREIVMDAPELAGAEREAYLARACGADKALRARVERLLAGGERGDAFLNADTRLSAAEAGAVPASESAGAQIGRYRLVRVIGEGGFGAVFLAEQEQPIRRRVALKIIKLGMDTRGVIARFEHERQALALMDHPNIAKVLDAGATATGRPYFVMELVDGLPITEFCDERRLSVTDRISLFLQVCGAVQHAHTKGIIHRDLKASNVLVAEHDGRREVKVIDFGIAKAIDHAAAGRTAFTEHRQFVGTPESMSPEQAEASPDIDTRSDVYSLGVLLYQLLTGLPPFDLQRLRSGAYAEIQRIIREEEPPRPSTRLSSQSETRAGFAASRSTDPQRLETMLRGELDWIVMRAMEKERSRRYGSAGELGADLERYLTGREVAAAPPSRIYRMRKFVRRNRAGVIAGSLVTASLLTGLAAALWQADEARKQRDAQIKATGEALQAKTDADQKRKDLEKVAAFQASQLKDIDAAQMGRTLREQILADAKAGMQRTGKPAEEIDARQDQLGKLLSDANLTNVALTTLDKSVFDRALKAVDEQFKDQPLIRADLLLTLASTLDELGLYERALGPMAQGLEIRRKELGDDSPATIDIIGNMGDLQYSMGNLPECEKYFAEALERARRTLGSEAGPTLSAMNNMAMVLQKRGKPDQAEPLYREALEIRRRKGPDDPGTTTSISNLGFFFVEQGKLAEAEPLMREALDRQRRLKGNEDTATLTMLANLGAVLQMQSKFEEAEPLMREALATRRRVFGDTHSETLQSMNNLGVLLQSLARYPEAEALFREALESRRKTFRPNHPAIMASIRALGIVLRLEGKETDAEPLLREVLEARVAVLGESHPDTAQSKADLGSLLAQMHKPEEAEPLLRAGSAGLEAKLGANHVRTADARAWLGDALAALGRREEAQTALLAAADAFAKSPGSLPDARRHCLKALVQLYEAWEAAEPGHGYAAKAGQWHSALEALPAPAK